MTKHEADAIGFWLKTPGGGPLGQSCGEAEAYTSELTPNKSYGGLSPRDYLRDKSWDERRQVGLEALKQFGVLKR